MRAVEERSHGGYKLVDCWWTCTPACLVCASGIMTTRPLSAKKKDRREVLTVPVGVELQVPIILQGVDGYTRVPNGTR